MIHIILTLCRLSAPYECEQHIVKTISMQGCMMGLPANADFMKDYPQYRLAGWRCEMGERMKVPA